MTKYHKESGVLGMPVIVYDIWASETCQTALVLVGTVFMLSVIARAVLLLLSFVRPSNLQIYCHCEKGSWALVTGASDDIGRAFSAELLDRGFNVLLHGRNEAKLTRVKDELSKSYPKRSIEIVVADASKQDESYRVVASKVKQLRGMLTVLVNNIGGVTTYPQYLPHADVPHEDIDVQLNTNVRFPTHLTRELLPILRENGPSLILNCGSSGGTIGAPYIVTYSSCKAYIHAFSSSLKNELTAEGIDNVDVLGLIIGNVTSAGNTHNMAFTITSQECAAASLDQVGTSKSLVYPHWKHAWVVWPLQYLPDRIIRHIIAKEMRKRRDVESKKI